MKLTFDATDDGVLTLLPPDVGAPLFCFFVRAGVFCFDGDAFLLLAALPGFVADAVRLPTGVASAWLLAALSAALSDCFCCCAFGMVLKRMGSDGNGGGLTTD